MEVKAGQRYRHYKGKIYTILALARNSATLDIEVVYQGEYSGSEFGDNPIWTRPIEEFIQSVEVEGDRVSRFELL